MMDLAAVEGGTAGISPSLTIAWLGKVTNTSSGMWRFASLRFIIQTIMLLLR
jgi:hypothetical protein